VCHPGRGLEAASHRRRWTGCTPNRQGCAARQLLTLLRQGNSSHVFEQINRYVHERLALFASKQHRQVGRGWRTRYPTSWLRRLGILRLSGTRVGRTLHAT
jgi:hypothetical protein